MGAGCQRSLDTSAVAHMRAAACGGLCAMLVQGLVGHRYLHLEMLSAVRLRQPDSAASTSSSSFKQQHTMLSSSKDVSLVSCTKPTESTLQ